MSILTFSKIVNKNIFSEDFKKFETNNSLEFSDAGICVVYGPNGTGKTSLIGVLSGAKDTDMAVRYEEKDYTTETSNQLFYIINDQNNRNIIAGEAKDFLLGDNIKKEYELKKFLEDAYRTLIANYINIFKTEYNLSSKSSKLLPLISDTNAQKFVSDVVNNKSKGENYNIDSLITIINGIATTSQYDCDNEKFKFFVNDYAQKNSIVESILSLSTTQIVINSKVHEIEENDEAIRVLGRFLKKTECVVCDTKDINPQELIDKKRQNRNEIINSIDKTLKSAIESVIMITPENDPFNIKSILINSIDIGNFQDLLKLQEEFKLYKEIFSQKICAELIKSISGELIKKNEDFKKILSEKPYIEDEDIFYLQQIISRSMGKDLEIVRDGKHNIRILLAQKDFINIDRGELPLSAGEQNFLSLTFEFLKAKNSEKEIIVIDDPISSFDSIYKNKIVFSLVRMLKDKKRIILTHNLDLVRLLNGQYKNCFRLYILDNSIGVTAHGFIPMKDEEKEMLIDLNKLLLMFRINIFSHILDVKAYLLSMIPFMRGYAHIINNTECYETLTHVMHGYETDGADLVKIYNELFNIKPKTLFPESYIVSVNDILGFNIDAISILDNGLPLLHKTLRHTFTYLYLRLLVEKTLVEKYAINTKKHEQLGEIIGAAFNDEHDINQIKRRTILTSKKTLINEFNHFEGNLSIFQPAIDITDAALYQEKAEIIEFVNQIKSE